MKMNFHAGHLRGVPRSSPADRGAKGRPGNRFPPGPLHEVAQPRQQRHDAPFSFLEVLGRLP
jgi:hypothetical protein